MAKIELEAIGSGSCWYGSREVVYVYDGVRYVDNDCNLFKLDVDCKLYKAGWENDRPLEPIPELTEKNIHWAFGGLNFTDEEKASLVDQVNAQYLKTGKKRCARCCEVLKWAKSTPVHDWMWVGDMMYDLATVYWERDYAEERVEANDPNFSKEYVNELDNFIELMKYGKVPGYNGFLNIAEECVNEFDNFLERMKSEKAPGYVGLLKWDKDTGKLNIEESCGTALKSEILRMCTREDITNVENPEFEFVRFDRSDDYCTAGNLTFKFNGKTYETRSPVDPDSDSPCHVESWKPTDILWYGLPLILNDSGKKKFTEMLNAHMKPLFNGCQKCDEKRALVQKTQQKADHRKAALRANCAIRGADCPHGMRFDTWGWNEYGAREENLKKLEESLNNWDEKVKTHCPGCSNNIDMLKAVQEQD